jgi:diazepam-binding inhibitor (GABA receptor modulating acyl-CoA-binding protein)
MAEEAMTLIERFEEAQARVKALPRAPDTATLLELYALFKQATAGDAIGKRPGLFDIKGRAKYDAWEQHRGTSREAAMESYVQLVDRLVAGTG